MSCELPEPLLALGRRAVLAPRDGARGAATPRLVVRADRVLEGREHAPSMTRVACPTALFAADHDRVVDSVRAARAMEALLPDTELTLLLEAGHVVLPLAQEPWCERLERLASRCGLAAGEHG